MHREMLIVAMLFSPMVVSAQGRDTTPIPRELATALVQGMFPFGDTTAITVGSVPTGFPSGLLPRSATLLGGVDFVGDGRSRSRGDLVVARLGVPPDSAMAILSAHLEREGWRIPKFPAARPGGFTSSMGFGNSLNKTFCRENRSLHASASARPAGGAFVTVSASGVANTVCDTDAIERRRSRQPWDDIELPELVPPAGVRGGRSGTGSSDGYRESTARLFTTNSVASLVEHFGEQLKRAGWAIGGRLDARDVSLLSATRTDTSGRRLTATLLATRVGDTERDLLFRVVVPVHDR
jgi:hypothetical protein